MIIQKQYKFYAAHRNETLQDKCQTKLFSEITQMGFRLALLEVQETDMSTISYTRENWIADNRIFARSMSQHDAEVISPCGIR
ncbi:MAG TPA: hypothetical protein PLR25_21585 [Planctomycetaceae bacterium]|nr:hypothetical protein [Planctomycetaceae bacterium]